VKFQMRDYMAASQECVGTKRSYAYVVWGTAGKSSNVTPVANMTDAMCQSTLTVNGLKGKGQQWEARISHCCLQTEISKETLRSALLFATVAIVLSDRHIGMYDYQLLQQLEGCKFISRAHAMQRAMWTKLAGHESGWCATSWQHHVSCLV
jgi:hypothetical protein